jgi:hypothetical protein
LTSSRLMVAFKSFVGSSLALDFSISVDRWNSPFSQSKILRQVTESQSLKTHFPKVYIRCHRSYEFQIESTISVSWTTRMSCKFATPLQWAVITRLDCLKLSPIPTQFENEL